MRMMRALKNPDPVSTQICLHGMLLSALVSRPCLSWKSLCLGNDHPNPAELLWSFSDDCYGRSHESLEESESLQQRESLHSVSARARIAFRPPFPKVSLRKKEKHQFDGGRVMGVVLALGAAGIGFVFGLFLLCVLGEKAWHQAIALSVGVFLVVLVGLVAQSSQLLLVGTVLVTSCSLLWWYVGLWTSIVVIIGVLGCSHAFLVVWPPQSSSSH